jgi:hypothetical protein
VTLAKLPPMHVDVMAYMVILEEKVIVFKNLYIAYIHIFNLATFASCVPGGEVPSGASEDLHV